MWMTRRRSVAAAGIAAVALLGALVAAGLPGASGDALALEAEGAPAAADPFDGLLTRTIVGLVLFAAALAVVLAVARRKYGARGLRAGRRLALLETLPLGSRRFVCLLSLDREKLFVVGVSGEGLRLLSESRQTPPAPVSGSFEAALEKAGSP